MNMSTTSARLLLCCVALGCGVGPLAAQTIYRIVGPDGKVTFSDKPPASAATVTATSASGRPIGPVENSVLPFELRQVVARYPVSLYSGAACAPCNSGRLLLQSRGIPFTEYTVSTPEDIEALQRLSGDNALPFLTIGTQKIKGFSESEWIQFLNAANYPSSSQLPTSFRNQPAKPLVVVQKPTPPKAEEEAKAGDGDKSAGNRTEAPAPEPGPSPTGIRF